MEKELPEHINFRLNLEDEAERMVSEYLADSKKGRRTDAIVKAIFSYLTSIHVSFDKVNPRDKAIIEKLEKIPEGQYSTWMKDRIFERLTGLDAITGEPLEAFVKVIEKEIPVIQERVMYVDKPVYIGQPPPVEIESASGNDEKAYDELSEVDW